MSNNLATDVAKEEFPLLLDGLSEAELHQYQIKKSRAKKLPFSLLLGVLAIGCVLLIVRNLKS